VRDGVPGSSRATKPRPPVRASGNIARKLTLCDSRHIGTVAGFPYSAHEQSFTPGKTAMQHSRLTQWIEDAEARQYLLAATWRPAVPRSPGLGKTILKMPAQVHYAAAQALSYMLRPRSSGRAIQPPVRASEAYCAANARSSQGPRAICHSRPSVPRPSTG
jgi:hypothetical protein